MNKTMKTMKTMYELKDCHGFTEDKAWLVGDSASAVVEFDNGDFKAFDSYDEASDWLWERGYR